METNKIYSSSPLKSFPTNGGKGPLSYANNCQYQKNGVVLTQALIYEEITKKLDTEFLLSHLNPFRISDMGCSVGPNTFIVVQNIIEAVKSKLNLNKDMIDFQVFFNDHSENDFNTLFKSLPVERNYFAAGVPGSFHRRLLPSSSLHLVNTSYALHWLSKIPEEIQDKNSPAWNKGKVHYSSSSKNVEAAYAAQFANDMESFLKARAEEIVHGGFLAVLLPCIPNEANPSKCTINALFEFMGSGLMDMVNMGSVDEAEVDSFNVPLYFPTQAEVETIIERNGCFKIEKMQQICRPMRGFTRQEVENFAMTVRAAMEEVPREHFGSEIAAEVFNRFSEKLVESCVFSDPTYVPMIDLFAFLKRI
uniref:SABATH methyltransferase 7 n=1 Tax=Bixa orellana TaxID=66672 RepID=A0A140CWV5_BIXOR|nr:SABATH methyltransferase 7 [Bixa orellana]